MSTNVERCLYRLKRAPGGPKDWTKDRWLRNEETSPLTQKEKKAILAADVETLWRMGVHPLLLLQFARSANIPAAQYYERIRNTGVASSLRS